MKHLFIKDIQEDLAIKIKVQAALGNMKIKDLIIAAVRIYLETGGKKP